ncbi:MAG: amino acid dehydrogenase [Saprospiraceae bacterium]|nr:amino acid dehydrogenase [Saprospiraceae bacterium]
MNLETVLAEYKEKEPEIVFEWKDQLTDARGWVVINSLRGGAAGGGTRMRKGLTRDEVVSLAKVMEIKFSVCGPSIGGAKSGIDFDPQDPRRTDVLKRWYAAVFPLLKNYYGTGGDLNVDEIKDVVPITEDLGLWHPQEGIVNGHLMPNKGEAISILGQLRYGCSKTVEDGRFCPEGEKRYAVADLITGYGVAESILHFHRIFKGENIEGKRVIIQGWGNVASAAALYLAKTGAKIVGIIDRAGGLISEQGMGYDEIEALFLNKENNRLMGKIMPFEEVNEKIWNVPCDVFVPGAASKIVTRIQAESLISGGCKVISCGANVPFTDDGIFFGETARMVDEKISLIPDFVANCGMARVFAYLMQSEAVLTDQGIFQDTSLTIGTFLDELYRENPSDTTISRRSLFKSLQKLK